MHESRSRTTGVCRKILGRVHTPCRPPATPKTPATQWRTKRPPTGAFDHFRHIIRRCTICTVPHLGPGLAKKLRPILRSGIIPRQLGPRPNPFERHTPGQPTPSPNQSGGARPQGGGRAPPAGWPAQRGRRAEASCRKEALETIWCAILLLLPPFFFGGTCPPAARWLAALWERRCRMASPGLCFWSGCAPRWGWRRAGGSIPCLAPLIRRGCRGRCCGPPAGR